jgi:hypothetical protein
MSGTCAMNDISSIIKLIGIFILICVLSIVVIYFMYCDYNKHSYIVDKFTGTESTLTNFNYGEGHDSGRTDIDKETIIGDITLRPCQVYFVSEDQQNSCDADYANNPSNTCKYVFKDDWKEIDTIKIADKSNTYPKKIYNQSYTKNNIVNHGEMAQCVKKFDSDRDRRYIYRNNELIKYNHGGGSTGDTLELNYRNSDSDIYAKGNFISMNFGNDNTPMANYSNVIDSICSKRINAPSGLDSNLRFYKFILNNSNEIKDIEMVMLDGEKKAFQSLDFNMRDFLNSDNLSINYFSNDNIFFLKKDSNIVGEQVDVYQFKYNYLCNNEESGKILEYKKDIFSNNKNYISLKNSNQSLNVELKYNGLLVKVPRGFENNFVDITTKNSIIEKIDQLKDNIKSNYNSNINSNIERIESEIQNYETHRDSANDAKNSFGVGMSFEQIIAYRFNKIINNDTTTTESIQPFNFEKGINITFISDDLPVNTADTGFNNILIYKHDGSTNNQTEYNVNFNVNTNCDILLVGGGGAGGGGDDGGGGGAGGLVLINNIILNGNYKILVGRGGVGDTTEYDDTDNGRDTIFNVDGTDGVNSFIAVGGGGGGVGSGSSNVLRDGNNGGSGGGSTGEYSNYNGGGSSTQNQYMYNGTRRGYGNRGGNNTNAYNYKGSAGGGGAGFPGTNSNSTNKGVPGGDGLSIVNSIDLKTHFNINDTTIGHHIDGKVYFAGGGGGGNGNNIARANNSGGKGGGGQGSTSGSGKSGSNGSINSGGGGGGAQIAYSWSWNGGYRGKGGNGGSGIVIIRENIFGGHCSDVNSCFTDSMKNEAHERADSLQHFINYDINELKYGAISGYIFLEKNIAYSNINITLSQTPSIVQDLRTRIESVSGDDILLDTVNTIGNESFTPTNSGFYKIKTTFISKNINTIQISSDYDISCNLNGSYFNLRDYIYIKPLWPESWNTIAVYSDEDKINVLNQNFRDMKYSNNTEDSVSALVNGYLNDIDVFNYNFWDSKISDLDSDKNKEYTIDNYPICNSSNAYNKNEYQNFTMKCNELKKLYDFKTTLNNALSPNNLEALFSGKSFDNPEFVKTKIETTFEGNESITNYITYEKKSNKEDRTQKSEINPYYNYFEDQTTERSIYILKT